MCDLLPYKDREKQLKYMRNHQANKKAQIARNAVDSERYRALCEAENACIEQRMKRHGESFEVAQRHCVSSPFVKRDASREFALDNRQFASVDEMIKRSNELIALKGDKKLFASEPKPKYDKRRYRDVEDYYEDQRKYEASEKLRRERENYAVAVSTEAGEREAIDKAKCEAGRKKLLDSVIKGISESRRLNPEEWAKLDKKRKRDSRLTVGSLKGVAKEDFRDLQRPEPTPLERCVKLRMTSKGESHKVAYDKCKQILSSDALSKLFEGGI